MERFAVALLQTAYDPNSDAMQAKYLQMIAEAASQGATLVCLPEFSLSPYFAAVPDAAVAPEPIPDGPSCRFFAEAASRHRVTLIGSLYEESVEGTRYDTAVLFGPDGALVGAHRKQHIPDDVGYYERQYFVSGDSDYPVFDLPMARIAAPTCYDQWFPELARIHALKGCEFLVYPTAIGSEPSAPDFDSQDAWTTIIRSHAIANGIFVAAVNRIGAEQGIVFYGSSLIVAPDGEVLAQGSRDREEIVAATLEPERMTRYRRLFPLLERREPHTYRELIR